METTFGILCFLPPLLAIILAIVTKQTILSLFVDGMAELINVPFILVCAWSIMMPIAFPMAVAFDLPFEYVVASVISGGLFGDQCSPVSDTKVMSSTGGSCNHVVHVMTQLPYGITVGVSAFIGFLFGGLTGQYWLSIAVTAVILAVALVVLNIVSKRTAKLDKATV